MTKELEAGSPKTAPHPARPATTPGTWVVTRDKVAVATQAPIGGNIICEAPEGFQDSMENWAANARLIAAAPDLLCAPQDLLSECVEYARLNKLHNDDGSPATNHAMRRARAALSKAGA